jgi:hypothetical protein
MKVNILKIRKGDIFKYSDRLGTHTVVAMGRAQKSAYRQEHDIAITYIATTDTTGFTKVGDEGYKFFRNWRSTVNKIN